MTSLAVLFGTILAGLLARRRWRRRLPARALIVSPRKSTVISGDGRVRSVQSVALTLSPEDLDHLWHPANLENLARTYWAFLTKVTLGFIRVVYGEDERRVVFLIKPLTLLRFGAPEYVLERDHGKVTWRIRDGLLVARAGRNGSGLLALDVGRADPTGRAGSDLGQATLYIEVEVANFYPAIATAFSMPVYEGTQSFLHVLVTHAFLRSLATLELAESRVGRLAERPDAPAPVP